MNGIRLNCQKVFNRSGFEGKVSSTRESQRCKQGQSQASFSSQGAVPSTESKFQGQGEVKYPKRRVLLQSIGVATDAPKQGRR